MHQRLKQILQKEYFHHTEWKRTLQYRLDNNRRLCNSHSEKRWFYLGSIYKRDRRRKGTQNSRRKRRTHREYDRETRKTCRSTSNQGYVYSRTQRRSQKDTH